MSRPPIKQYGLIDPKAKKPKPRPAIFNSDSESDGDNEKPTGITSLKKKERIAQEKAIAEDPTIYQYDELYDDIQTKRKESKLARKDLDKKPKYINKLLESAERRKRDNERRIEREVQKEREAEGDMFKDKESFVTSGYRKKLEEMKELEEKEKREDYLESIGDVQKQGDLSGFYRHLYAQKVNFEEEEVKQEKLKSYEKERDDKGKVKPSETSTHSTDGLEDNTSAETSQILQKQTVSSKKRKYRKRETSKSDDNSEPEEKVNLEHLQSNIDADSDFSIDSESSANSDSEADSQIKSKKAKKEDKTSQIKTDNIIDDKGDKGTKNAGDGVKGNIKTKTERIELKDAETSEKKENAEGDVKKEIIDEPEVPKKPKIDIWKKRTVGSVFDDALKRFYERKAAKTQSV